ncbi:MAG: NAD(+) synthase [Clostridia bacterium]|nr:NAD(+) synthase [Clostridia bacterium]
MAWAEREAERIAGWLVDKVRAAGAAGFVVGLSGGVDSALVACLATRAVPGRVWAYALPCRSSEADLRDAALVARHLALPFATVDLAPVEDAFLAALEPAAGEPSRLARGNLRARLRMIALNHLAARHRALVLGTGNASELYVGYFTKWGDGGVDLLPIGHLVKREVRLLASALGLPAAVVGRTPTAGLWEGQTDEDELGFRYDELDAYIREGPEAVPAEVAQRILSLHEASAHKRAMPPMPEPPATLPAGARAEGGG